jgi:hypothetical protein
LSNDTPISESQFKTLKYWPEFPQRFASYDHGLTFCREFRIVATPHGVSFW